MYGDPAYNDFFGVLAPFRTVGITAEQQDFNDRMRKGRVQVEQSFGLVSKEWRSNGLPTELHSGRSPVAAYYMNSVLLTNMLICLRQKKTRFGVKPPEIEEYLQLQLSTINLLFILLRQSG